MKKHVFYGKIYIDRHSIVPSPPWRCVLSAADRIGLLPGFGWMAGHNMVLALLICWLIAPVGFWVCQLLLESTIPTLDPAKNYKSFFPGDLFLGVMVASMLVLCDKRLPAEPRFYNSAWWHILWFTVMFIVAAVLTWLDYKDGHFTLGQLLSPSKFYHNWILYWMYGYVAVTSLWAFFIGNPWSDHDPSAYFLLACGLGCGIWWAAYVVQDSTAAQSAKTRTAAPSAPVLPGEPATSPAGQLPPPPSGWNPVFLPPFGNFKRL